MRTHWHTHTQAQAHTGTRTHRHMHTHTHAEAQDLAPETEAASNNSQICTTGNKGTFHADLRGFGHLIPRVKTGDKEERSGWSRPWKKGTAQVESHGELEQTAQAGVQGG